MSVSVVPRQVFIDGHRTSMRLEPIFWTMLDDISEREGKSVGALISDIIRTASRGNASSIVRVFCADYFHQRAAI
ncbi:MAG TPA: ribbon-helix-helix domain-containing protein [Acetobacteraceae bacterium]|jgi:predicted DNA-binding ribbon-helix-helix protein|nr:ribbon-helix-helix domain-containing protein [Acetobacteraceae bacterium]